MPVTTSYADPELELIDPTPNIYALFVGFDKEFFSTKLSGRAVVRWSKRMYSCAGTCSYEGRGGLCDIALSEPLLKLRPRKDLVETLLHEMIHAFLFVTNRDQNRDGHGPNFKEHMHRINKAAGLNITIYHDFHNEVKLYLTHWWRCNGPCKKTGPYFGIVRRSSNRAPGPTDYWWKVHRAKCGGTFEKIKEPPKKNLVKKKVNSNPGIATNNGKPVLNNTNTNSRIYTIKTIQTTTTSSVRLFSGNGHSINNNNPTTSTNPISESRNVTEHIRNVWANKHMASKAPSNSTAGTSTSNPNKHKADTLHPSPPAKIKRIDDYFKANATLRKLYGENFKLPKPHSNNSINDDDKTSESIECPVCNARIGKIDINKHLDECLNRDIIQELTQDNQQGRYVKSSQTNTETNRINNMAGEIPNNNKNKIIDLTDLKVPQNIRRRKTDAHFKLIDIDELTNHINDNRKKSATGGEIPQKKTVNPLINNMKNSEGFIYNDQAEFLRRSNWIPLPAGPSSSRLEIVDIQVIAGPSTSISAAVSAQKLSAPSTSKSSDILVEVIEESRTNRTPTISAQIAPRPSTSKSTAISPQISPKPGTSKSPTIFPQTSAKPGTSKSPTIFPQKSPKPGTSKSPTIFPQISPKPGTSKSSVISTQISPKPGTSKSPTIFPQISPKPGTSKSPVISTQTSPKPGTSKSPVISTQISPKPGTSKSPTIFAQISPKPGTSQPLVISTQISPKPGTSKSPHMFADIVEPAMSKSPAISILTAEPGTSKPPANSAQTIGEPDTSRSSGTPVQIKVEPRSSEISDPTADPVIIENSEKDMQKCPCCQKKFSTSVEEHLDDCLAFVIDNSMLRYDVANRTTTVDDVIVINDNDDEFDESLTLNSTGTKTPCPCCMRMVEQKAMNDHLEFCLGLWND